LTLYAYLEKIAGPHFIKIYSVVNGALFCILAGAMITVSASAIRILFGLEPQTGLFPTDLRWIRQSKLGFRPDELVGFECFC